MTKKRSKVAKGPVRIQFHHTKSKRIRFETTLLPGGWSRSYANRGAARRAAVRLYPGRTVVTTVRVA